jgi:hypothetical protein
VSQPRRLHPSESPRGETIAERGKPERPERPGRAERPERRERAERPEKPGKPKKLGKLQAPGKPEELTRRRPHPSILVPSTPSSGVSFALINFAIAASRIS